MSDVKTSQDVVGYRRIWRVSGAPSDGAAGTLYGRADPGDVIVDTATSKLYVNSNTKASPVWSQILSADVAFEGDVVITGDITLATEDVSVAQGKYVFLEGQSSTTYLRADAVGYLMANAATGVNLAVGGTDVVQVTASLVTVAQDVTLADGKSLALGTTGKITLRGTAGYPTGIGIWSAVADKLNFFAPSTGEDAISLRTGVGGQVKIRGAYLCLHITDTDGAYEAEMWFDNSEDKIKYYGGGAVRTVAALNQTQTFTAQCRFSNTPVGLDLMGASKLYIRDDYIDSPSSGKIRVKVTGTSEDSIILQTGTGGQIGLYGGYLRLLKTNVDGGREAEIWFADASNTIRFYGGGAVQTLADTVHTQTFAGQCSFSHTPVGVALMGDSKLYLRDDYIDSPTSGKIRVKVGSTAENAIMLQTGSNIGQISMYGYLKLLSTASDGAYNGEMWYNPSTHELMVWKDGAAKTVTTS